MLNAEKYRDEILLELESNIDRFAITKGHLTTCSQIDCTECELNERRIPCSVKFMTWLLSEYKPRPTRAEKFMEMIKGSEFEEVYAIGELGMPYYTNRNEWWNAESEGEDDSRA